MLSLLSNSVQMVSREWVVWGLLGAQSVIVMAVAISALAARGTRTLVARRRRSACQVFYERLSDALSRLPQAGNGAASVRRRVESLLPLLPAGPVGAFLRWRAVHLGEPPAVAQKIALLVGEAEGCSGRLLDVARVSSPLLGLAGTLLGLQQAFGQASLGKTAVEAGIATALNTTYAGIFIALAALFTLRFLVDPALEALETELWEADLTLSELYARGGVPGVMWPGAGQDTVMPVYARAADERPRRPSPGERQWQPCSLTLDDESVDG